MIHVAILAFQGRLSSACQQYVNLSIGTQFTRLENRMPEGERFDQAKFVRVLKIEGKCSCLRAKAAYISGHLPCASGSGKLGEGSDKSAPMIGIRTQSWDRRKHC